MVTALLALVMLLVSFGVAAAAAGQMAPDESLLDLFRPVIDAAVNGHPYLAAALALVFGAAVARRYGGRYWGFLNTPVGSALTVLVGAFGGAAAVPLATASLSTAIVWNACKVAFYAAGGYSLAKPLLRYLSAVAPAWMQPMLSLVMWVFDKPDKVAGAVAAGQAAVTAKPPTGLHGMTGTPRDVE